MDVTVLEECGGAAEDEIGDAGDPAVLKILAALEEENRVLPAEEPALAKDGTIARDADREGLAAFAEAIGEGDVAGGEAIVLKKDGGAFEGAQGMAIGIQ